MKKSEVEVVIDDTLAKKYGLDINTMDPFDLRDAITKSVDSTYDNSHLDYKNLYDEYAVKSVENYLRSHGKELLVEEGALNQVAKNSLAVAWEEHHSAGYREVLNAVTDYADIVLGGRN